MIQAATSPIPAGVDMLTDKRGSPDARPELLLDRRQRLHPLSGLVQSLGKLPKRLSHHFGRNPALCLIWIGAAALTAFVAYLGASLHGALVAPVDAQPTRPFPPEPAAISPSVDPVLTPAAIGSGPIDATDLTLHGIRRAGPAGGGSAIISQPGGLQRSFAAGARISATIVLKQVGSDHVIIARHGVDQRLALKAFESTEPLPNAAARPAAPYALATARPAADIRPRAPAPRRPAGFPPRSIDFADPSTLPASLTNAAALPDRRPSPNR